MHPPHQPKTNDFGRKISLHFEKSVSISGCIPPTSLNPNDFGRKIRLHFGEDLFFWRPVRISEKSGSISVKTFFFFLETTWIWAEKTFEFPKNQAQFRWRPYFYIYLFIFWRPPEFGRKKRSNFRKIRLNFGEDLFFVFFGDHLNLGGKNVRISDFGRKFSLHFSEDIRSFEVLCLKF